LIVPARETERLAAFANRLADASRELIAKVARQSVRSEVKADGSPVTRIDRAVESRLRDMIADEHPDHGVVGEEHGAQMPDREFVWVLDPIDGTLPFLAGIPVFGTLIALARDGTPVLGVVDMPVTGERWVGGEAMPTTRNNEPVGVRSCAGLDEALLSTSNPDLYSSDERETFERLKAKTRWCVYGGSCLAYAQIASGRIDVGIDGGLDPFDYCALVPIILGAGGVISDWQGTSLTLHSGSRILAAGDPKVHTQALRVLADAQHSSR
jgi:histidinol phosphatase-like enzyme (inositol monophosphatase family)